jgi:hypothetical protein
VGGYEVENRKIDCSQGDLTQFQLRVQEVRRYAASGVSSWLYTNNVWFSAGNTNIESCPGRVEYMAVLAALPGKKQIFQPRLLVARGSEPEILEMEFREGTWNRVISACLKPHLPFKMKRPELFPGIPVLNAEHLCMKASLQ